MKSPVQILGTTSLPVMAIGGGQRKVSTVPQNSWGRVRNGQQQNRDEYPEQVPLQEDAEIKWTRFLSAALNTPQWLALGMTACIGARDLIIHLK